jgi:2-oxoglutarate dehydrogenase E2 component (dihydrolipoamide succinyltransferase)
MSGEIRVPTLGESVSEATIARWLKKAGEAVKVDEPLVELETDKVSLEVPAPMAGVLAEIMAEEGSDVEVGALLGMIEEGEGTAAGQAAKPEARSATPEKDEAAPAPAQAPAKPARPSGDGAGKSGPAARKLAAEKGLELGEIDGTGPKGNVTKGDVLKAEKPAEAPAAPPSAKPAPAPAAAGGREERVRMTRLRKRIAERLKEAQNTAAMLTTFNEVDMSAVMELRKAYQDAFVKKHGIKLGFMSFFVKACIDALKAFPAANSEIDGDEVVYKHYYDIGVAVSSDAGLVVPVVRGADAMNLAQIEAAIADLGTRAKSGKLAMDELTGGTFTITNGGIFGSMLSTPILNPPQVGILGMHNIVQRPVVVDGGRIEARPVMYLALSYDHRIIDGREAVSFLVRVKECIEDPTRMLLDA